MPWNLSLRESELSFRSRPRRWAVVLVGQQQTLPVYDKAAGAQTIYSYGPRATGIASSGKTTMIRSTEWLPVDTPRGVGWVYCHYLTEEVDLEEFAGDSRPSELVHEFASRLRKGGDLTPLISRRGLVVAMTGPPTKIPPERLEELLGRSRLHRFPTTGTSLDTNEIFEIAVARPFIEAYDATDIVTASTPHSRRSLIPAECWNFPYLALGIRDKVQPWLVFFDYRNGKATIAGLGIDE